MEYEYLWAIPAALLILVAVLLIRALRFKPARLEKPPREEIGLDTAGVIEALRQLIRCKTVSRADPALEDAAEFEKLEALLPQLYPRVFAACSLQKLPDRGLLLCLKGREQGAPSVMMAHYDVVPADGEGWEKPPFEGIVEDGVLWGRGALDTKVTLNAVLFAANTLLEQGFQPQNDLYFAFSGGEEVNGKGAQNIVEYFKKQGITPALVLDEGGAVVEDVFPGVKRPCGLIGIAEKGMMNLTLSVESGGGHASAPPPHTSIGILSRACCALEQKPFPMHLTEPAARMFDTLGRHSTFLYRVIFANLWLFKGVLNRLCKKSGGELNALLRTTVAFTKASGSDAPNVLPTVASMTANLRLNPEDSVQGALDRIQRTVDDSRIKLTVGSSMEPSRISVTDCPAWEKVAGAVAETWQGCIVAPYLMVQCSDSRHYGAISDRVYRFSAMDLTAEERKTIHGVNERIRVDAARRAAEFYVRLIKQC